MRELTFRGFVSRYVRDLSLCDSGSLYRLAREADLKNPRLREPLFIHAVLEGKTDVLLKAARDCDFYGDYEYVNSQFTRETMLVALSEQRSDMPDGYLKVWRSYQAVAAKPKRDNRVKELMRVKITELQLQKGVTTYRISKDNGMNNANVNAWLKSGVSEKVSLTAARKMLEYLEQQ